MQTQISHSTLKLHNERLDQLVLDLQDKFPDEPIHPKENIESIMYKAGQQSVVQYVKSYLQE